MLHRSPSTSLIHRAPTTPILLAVFTSKSEQIPMLILSLLFMLSFSRAIFSLIHSNFQRRRGSTSYYRFIVQHATSTTTTGVTDVVGGSSSGTGITSEISPTSTAQTTAAQAGMNLYTLSAEDLTSLLKSWGQPAFRTKQIREWIYDKGCLDFARMENLPAELRSKLSAAFTLGALQIASEQVSKDGTMKRAYQLHDKQLIESVLMPYEDGRRTACISSQAGCAMGCVFCATGQMGFSRQLTSTEIFEQAQQFSAELKARGERLSNVVMMGMGEPLANYANVMEAVRRMHDELGIGYRHITISTVGLAPRIRKLAEDNAQIGLAVSLHQATDAKRDKLMPVNLRYPIPELLDACRYYVDTTHRRISFEWALIRDETDTAEVAHELGQLLRGILCHVNVIPLNPTSGYGGKPTSKKGVDDFIRVLAEYGITCTARMRRGIDIDAGCGQLKAALVKKKAELAKVTESTLDAIDRGE